MDNDQIKLLLNRIQRERLARKQAEMIIEEKSRELYNKNIELERAVAAERQAREEIERLSNTDYLTGLSNRRHFNISATIEFQRSIRYGRPLSAIMMDIDHFKQVNDNYGHAFGDIVLIAVASACLSMLRSHDICSRYGGEEFSLLLPETETAGAYTLAERIRGAIAGLNFDAGDKRFSVTASLGVAQRITGEDNFEVLLRRADEALYKAKNEGRNGVVVYNTPEESHS